MGIQQRPVPGFYYINLTGQMIKVKALLYVEGELSRVMIEYLDGRLININVDEWSWLDLSIYSEWLETRKQRQDVEYEV